jgi:ankyrin repeat protein
MDLLLSKFVFINPVLYKINIFYTKMTEMKDFILLDENRIISQKEMVKFVINGYARYEHLVGSPVLIKKSFINRDYRKNIDNGFSILIRTYFFISEKRIVYTNEAKIILRNPKINRINHFIGTKLELIEYSKNRTALNKLHTDLMFDFLANNKFDLGSVDKLSMMNIANYMTDKSVGSLSRVSKIAKNISVIELRNRANYDKILAAKMGYDDILIKLEPTIYKRVCLAAKVGNLEYLKTMISSLPESSLIYTDIAKTSASNNHIDIIKFMSKNYICDVNVVLKYAYKYGHMNILKWTQKNVHKLYHRTGFIKERSILCCAARCGNIDYVKLLIDEGDTMTNIDNALSVGARYGNIDIVKILISAGATNNDYVLIAGIRSGNIDLVKLLICKGDNNINNGLSNIALTDAAKSGNIDLVKLLISNGATNINNVLYGGVRINNINMIKFAFAKGAVWERDLLPFAAESGCTLEVIKLLVDKGYDSFSNTLHASSGVGNNIDIVKFMLTKRDYTKEELDSALDSSVVNNNFNIVKLLISTGATSTLRVKTLCKEEGYYEILDILEKSENS